MRVFATVGSSLDPFDRFLRILSEALPADVDGVCQHGVSTLRPRQLVAVSSLSKADFDREMRAADVVICHAGVGTLWSAIHAGHCPLVIARRRAFKEIVNDHQLEICSELAARKQILVVENAQELEQALKHPPGRDTERGEVNAADALTIVGRAFESLARVSPRKFRPRLIRWLSLLSPPLDELRKR